MKNELFKQGLSSLGPFAIKFDREENQGDFIFEITDKDDQQYAKVFSHSFKDGLRHALHYADPLLATAAFDDNLEWSETHKIVETDSW